MMNLKRDNRELLINVLLGIILISAPFLSSPDLSSGLEVFKVPPFQRNFLAYSLLLAFFFTNVYVLVPKFYLKKEWLWYTLSIIGCYIIILKLPYLLVGDDIGMMSSVKRSPFTPLPPPDKPNMVMEQGVFSRDSYFFQFIVLFLLSLFIRIEKHLVDVKNDQLRTEVSYLKAQMNPHFLFNTLNNLYALTLTKSDDAPSSILKLSELMRFMVSESNQETIDLGKEVNYIKNFISLQKLRLTDNIKLTTNFSGDFSDSQIAPLLLISFIENAFKYGVNSEEESEIIIDLVYTKKTNKNCLLLRVENTIVDLGNTQMVSTKQGLENSKNRLKVLYPNKHDLTISTKDKRYNVALQIQLE